MRVSASSRWETAAIWTMYIVGMAEVAAGFSVGAGGGGVFVVGTVTVVGVGCGCVAGAGVVATGLPEDGLVVAVAAGVSVVATTAAAAGVERRPML